MKTQLLTDEFISKYKEFPDEMNALGTLVYLRTYSRFRHNDKRREYWIETIRRSVEYNVGLVLAHYKKKKIPYDIEALRKEAEELFDNEYNLKQSLSGRTKWVGGAENGVADKYPLANFNCSFTNIMEWTDLGDLFYLLLVGTGVGFKATKEMAAGLAPIKVNMEVEHIPYAYAGKANHLENSVILRNEHVGKEPSVTIYVGDSKEGWVQSLNHYLTVLTDPEYSDVKKIIISYNHVRPEGAKLNTFGGTASGPQPLIEMFEGFQKVLKNEIDTTLAPIVPNEEGYGQVRPIHILDMGNLIGNNVVVGGVRRTAEIFLLDEDDFESLWAKYGVNGYWKEEDFQKHEALKAYCDKNGIETPAWFDKIGERHYDETVNIDFVTKEPRREADGSLSPYNFGTGFYHRAMSNNSIAFYDKPKKEFLAFVFELMKTTGEPGFINLYEAARRRLAMMGIKDPKIIRAYAKMIGLNPCAEILLYHKGVCNLTTVNVKAFVYKDEYGKYRLDLAGLLEAQRKSARAGLRMTLVDLELPEWDENQKRDHLTGTSLTGWKDALALLEMEKYQEDVLMGLLSAAAREESLEYAKFLRVPAPLLVTTVKPEGTLSQVFGGVSPGLHWAHSEYYIRRIRINAQDPLAFAVLEHDGWNVNPEVGTPGATKEERMANARTYVIDFPVYSGTKVTKEDVTVQEQFDTYFAFQEKYCDHNASNTITIKPHEWEDAMEIVFANWENFVGVSFLALDGGTYQLAPYEAVTKEQFESLEAAMQPFDMEILQKYDKAEDTDLDDTMEGCEGGICPIR